MRKKNFIKIVILIVLVLIITNTYTFFSTNNSPELTMTQTSDKYTYSYSNVSRLAITLEYIYGIEKHERILGYYRIGNKIHYSTLNPFTILNNLNGKKSDKGEIEFNISDSGVMVYCQSYLSKSVSQDFSIGNILEGKGLFKDYRVENKVKTVDNERLTFELVSIVSTKESSKFIISIKAE